MRSRRRSLAAALLFAALMACGGDAPKFRGVDITGFDYGGEIALRDTSGAKRTLADYRGKVAVLYFGYMNCPDVCPTTLAALREAMTQLGADAGRVQVLFVTVDPERDTPLLLEQYVKSFDPRFQGLTGSLEEVGTAAKQFKIFFAKSPGKEPGSYSVDHSTQIYLIDATGRARIFLKHDATPADFAQDIRTLLAQAKG
ncbi:MAG: SCO family protein [Betaproteobacteria bacterium]|nr:SCO family protein [Betaproteobacteria bacterium]